MKQDTSFQAFKLLQAFIPLDINRDGYVSKAELVSYLKSLVTVLEKDEEDSTVLNFIYRSDLNRDGKVSYPEFVRSYGVTLQDLLKYQTFLLRDHLKVYF